MISAFYCVNHNLNDHVRRDTGVNRLAVYDRGGSHVVHGVQSLERFKILLILRFVLFLMSFVIFCSNLY